jgi:hypothetical protein
MAIMQLVARRWGASRVDIDLVPKLFKFAPRIIRIRPGSVYGLNSEHDSRIRGQLRGAIRLENAVFESGVDDLAHALRS